MGIGTTLKLKPTPNGCRRLLLVLCTCHHARAVRAALMTVPSSREGSWLKNQTNTQMDWGIWEILGTFEDVESMLGDFDSAFFATSLFGYTSFWRRQVPGLDQNFDMPCLLFFILWFLNSWMMLNDPIQTVNLRQSVDTEVERPSNRLRVFSALGLRCEIWGWSYEHFFSGNSIMANW